MDAEPADSPPFPLRFSNAEIGALLLIVATTAFAHAVMWGHLAYDEGAVRFVLLGTVALVLSLLFLGDMFTSRTTALLAVGVGVALITQTIAMLSVPPTLYRIGTPDLQPYHVGQFVMVLGLALHAVSFLKESVPLRIARTTLLYAGFAITGMAVFLISPSPGIDVFELHRQAATDLLAGTSPYSLSQPVGDSYMGSRTWNAYPYPPITLLLQLPAHVVLEDTRFTNLVAMILAAFFIGRIARAAGMPENVADAIGAFALLQPRAFYVLEQSWTEPITIVLLAAATYAYLRNRLVAAAILFGLAVVSKQYMVLLAPLLLLLPRFDWKHIGIAAGTAIASLLPFFAWDPKGFWNGVVESQLDTPTRLGTSNSLAGYLFRHHPDYVPPEWLAFTLWVLVAFVVAYWRRRVPMTALVAFVVSLATLFNLGKQAFPNYFWLMSCLGALLLALVPLNSARQERPSLVERWIHRPKSAASADAQTSVPQP